MLLCESIDSIIRSIGVLRLSEVLGHYSYYVLCVLCVLCVPGFLSFDRSAHTLHYDSSFSALRYVFVVSTPCHTISFACFTLICYDFIRSMALCVFNI